MLFWLPTSLSISYSNAYTLHYISLNFGGIFYCKSDCWCHTHTHQTLLEGRGHISLLLPQDAKIPCYTQVMPLISLYGLYSIHEGLPINNRLHNWAEMSSQMNTMSKQGNVLKYKPTKRTSILHIHADVTQNRLECI